MARSLNQIALDAGEVDITLQEIDVLKVEGFSKILRQLAFLIINFVSWPLMIIARLFGLVDYLFLVYPGTESDLLAYVPKCLAKFYSGRPTIGGIITKSSRSGVGRGLYLVVPDNAMELLRNKKLCQDVADRIRQIQAISGAKAIGMAGQLPWIFERHGIPLEPPFTRGDKGILFSITEALSEIEKTHHRLKTAKIVVVGAGELGDIVLSGLKSEGYDVTGITVKLGRNGIKLPENATLILKEADFVILLTPRGDDFLPYIGELKPGSGLIDETHPPLSKITSGVPLYKVAMGLPGSTFFPRLPGYYLLPGCLIETIVANATNCFDLIQKEFNRAGRELGFIANSWGLCFYSS